MKTNRMTIKDHTTIMQQGCRKYQAYYWCGDPDKPSNGFAGVWRPIGCICETKKAAYAECQMFIADNKGE